MRPEGNPLDLNNLPDDFSRDGKQQFLDEASTGYNSNRKKKSGKEECGKVYECRFCSLKFCKSQALGGHMNRHRQERETETLNRARQLVFSNDTLAAQTHLSCCHPITPPGSGYHHSSATQGSAVDPTIPLRFPTRMFSGGSSSGLGFGPPPPPPPMPPQQPPQPYLYTSSPNRPLSFSTHYHQVQPAPPPNNEHYYVGHVLGGNSGINYNNVSSSESNYTCIGAPVGPHGFTARGNSSATELAESGGRDANLH